MLRVPSYTFKIPTSCCGTFSQVQSRSFLAKILIFLCDEEQDRAANININSDTVQDLSCEREHCDITNL